MMMSEWWKEIPWRMIQTNLREVDMLDMDADRYVKDLQSFGATVCLLNTAGIIASYETELEYHYQSPYLKGDSLKTVVDKCHAAGIKVIARTDFSKVRREIYEQHPEWAYRTKDGNIVDYRGNVHVCPNGGYQREYMFGIISEFMRKIPLDGIFCNFAGFYANDYDHHDHGLCYCENCKTRFREYCGLELPAEADLSDVAYRKHRIFIQECTDEHNDRLYKLLKSINPDLAVQGRDYLRMESNTEYNRPLPHWQHSAASNTRIMRGTGESGTIPSNTSVDFIGFQSRYISVGDQLQEIRLWQDLANLGGLDYYQMGRLDQKEDRSGFEVVKKVFHFHKKHESVFAGLKARADALMIRGKHWSDSSEERGWVRALTENHILFDECIPEEALKYTLDKYKVIILPDQRYLPEGLPEKLDSFAKAGGVVVCTGCSGFINHKYETLETPALECLGIEKVLYSSKDVITAVLMMDDKDKQVFQDFKDSELVGIGEEFIFTELKKDAESWMKYVLPSPAGPPELVYYSKITNIHGVSKYRYGKGAGIMVPWFAGKVFYKEGYQNTMSFMKGILEGLCGLSSVAPDLTPMVEVTVSDKPGQTVLQFVNTSGHYGTSYYAPLPICGVQSVVPVAAPPKAVYCLTEAGEVSFSYKDGLLYITLEKLENYEAVVCE